MNLQKEFDQCHTFGHAWYETLILKSARLMLPASDKEREQHKVRTMEEREVDLAP